MWAGQKLISNFERVIIIDVIIALTKAMMIKNFDNHGDGDGDGHGGDAGHDDH